MRKMYKISNWFILGLAIWLGIFSLRKNGVIIPFVNDHLTDLITIPMYCYLIQYIMNGFLGYNWKPDLKFIITSTVYLSLLFEVICPRISTIFTADIVDVIAYSIGGFLYYRFNKIYQIISSS